MCMCRAKAKWRLRRPQSASRKSPHPKLTMLVSTLILDLQTPELSAEINVCCLSDILLWQPEQTKTWGLFHVITSYRMKCSLTKPMIGIKTLRYRNAWGHTEAVCDRTGIGNHALDPCQRWRSKFNSVTCVICTEWVANVQHTQVYSSLLYNYQLITTLFSFYSRCGLRIVLNMRH